VFTVPPVVVTFDVVGGRSFAGTVVASVEASDRAVFVAAGPVVMKAEGGNPPKVAASPAFMA
jgi:hypothetical protein